MPTLDTFHRATSERSDDPPVYPSREPPPDQAGKGILNPANKPFKTWRSADLAAKKAEQSTGLSHQIISLDGGYVVSPLLPPPPEPADDATPPDLDRDPVPRAPWARPDAVDSASARPQPLALEDPRPYARASAMDGAESFFTFEPTGRALKGAGQAALDIWTALPQALKGVGTLASDAAGHVRNAVAPQRSVLTGQAFPYQPQSALLQSLEDQGVLGTVGAGITGAVRQAPFIGMVSALASPNRDWGKIGAQALSSGAVAAGIATSMRPPPFADFSAGVTLKPGAYRADPKHLRFMQPTASPNFSDGGTIDKLANDLRTGRVIPERVGSPLRVVMMDGVPFSFDNRRLVAFNMADEPHVPIQITTLDNPEFAKKVENRFNPIRGQGQQVAIVPAAERLKAQRDMHRLGLIAKPK